MNMKDLVKFNNIIDTIVLYTGVSREGVIAVLLTYQDITKEVSK
jgi:hypothetical protein